MILFLLWITIISISCLNLVRRYFPSREFSRKLLDFFTLFYGEVLLGLTILGLAGAISALYFTLYISVFLAVSTALSPPNFSLVRWKRSFPIPESKPLFLFLLICTVYLFNIFAQGIIPILTTDGLLYHLPIAVNWLQHGRFLLLPLPFTDIAMTYYPIGGEMVYLFHLLPLNDSPLLNFVQLPFVVYAAVAVYLLSDRFNLPKTWSFLAATLFILIKPVFMETSLVYVELMMVAFFLASLYYLGFGTKKGDFLLGAVSTGLLVSIKTLSLPFLLPLLPFLLKPLFRTGLANRNGAWSFRFAFIFLLSVFGFYSYLNNLFVTGNPLFPVSLNFRRFEIFPGIYRYVSVPLFLKCKMLFSVLSRPMSMIDLKTYFLALLSLGWFVGLVGCLKKKNLTALIMALPLWCLIAYCLFVPGYYFQTRHLILIYPIMIIGWLFFFNEIKAFRKNKNLETLLIFATLLLFFLQFPKPINFVFFIWSVFLYFTVTAFHEKARRGKPELWFKTLSYFLLFIVLFFGYAYLRVINMAKPTKFLAWKHYYGTEAEVWKWVDENTRRKKQTIAYVGNFFLYPLYGDNLRNTVYYQPINSIDEKLVHQYHFDKAVCFPAEMEKLEGVYREMPDYTVWKEGLKSHGTNWILIRKETGKTWTEEEWISRNPENFNLIFENNFAKIYTFETSALTNRKSGSPKGI
ncbi:MAG: hypothetical protein WC081_07575 [Candidatus Ratteibacteria bacterium]